MTDREAEFEVDFERYRLKYRERYDSTKKEEGVQPSQIESEELFSRKWVSELINNNSENNSEEKYLSLIVYELKMIIDEAERKKNHTGDTKIAVKLYYLGLFFASKKRTREGCRCLAMAYYYLDTNRDILQLDNFYNVLEPVRKTLENERKLLRRKMNGKKGGEAKARKIRLAHPELIRLLNTEKRPEAGWKSKEKAINAVTAKLLEFIEEKSIPLFTDSLYDTVMNWSEKYENVKNAFSDTSQKRRFSK
ncbi:hypothetical protein PGS49_21765 [Yersinia intermedia]|uniref:hypothetical protein n=1 Tax=Yersinia intermedia TaxID=631 RepID=UPI0022FE7451|nr:hypothetical protein [Yersinia intermedia]MDA5483244.1 hypothetical protein [Yersinia intermedia]